MRYTINIRETLERLVEVEADSAEAALLKVKACYDNGNIVLNSGDFKDTEFYEMGKPKDSYEVYKLKIGADSRIRELNLLSYEELAAKGKTVSKSNYCRVYTAELLPGTGPDDIYKLFDSWTNCPENYRGYSITYSDVIVIHEKGTDKAYYVDSSGYKEVPEFLQPEEKK